MNCIQEEVGKLLDSMIEIHLRRKIEQLDYYKDIGIDSYIKQMCTIHFGMSRQSGHSFNAINVIGKQFNNPCFVYEKLQRSDNYKNKKFIITMDGDKLDLNFNIDKHYTSITSFRDYVAGRTFDCLVIDIPIHFLTGKQIELIYEMGSALINNDNYEKFTILFLG